MAQEAVFALRPVSRATPGTLGRRLCFVLFSILFACAALAAPPKKNPSWTDLTPEQQQTLAPLAAEWSSIEPARRNKWVGIAKRYPAMSSTEQQRMQTRMADWVKLTPEQRREAREQYRKIGKLTPGKREVVSQQWEEYQQLPEAVKKNLAGESKKQPDSIEPRSRARTAQAKKSSVIAEPQSPSPAMSTVIPTSAN